MAEDVPVVGDVGFSNALARAVHVGKADELSGLLFDQESICLRLRGKMLSSSAPPLPIECSYITNSIKLDGSVDKLAASLIIEEQAKNLLSGLLAVKKESERMGFDWSSAKSVNRHWSDNYFRMTKPIEWGDEVRTGFVIEQYSDSGSRSLSVAIQYLEDKRIGSLLFITKSPSDEKLSLHQATSSLKPDSVTIEKLRESLEGKWFSKAELYCHLDFIKIRPEKFSESEWTVAIKDTGKMQVVFGEDRLGGIAPVSGEEKK